MGELVIILLIVLLVFGAGRVAHLGDALGRGIKNFKRAMKGDDEIEVTPTKAPEIEAKPVVEERVKKA